MGFICTNDPLDHTRLAFLSCYHSTYDGKIRLIFDRNYTNDDKVENGCFDNIVMEVEFEFPQQH